METRSPVGRLAPSPTGLLHLGHARTFLLAWWSARSRGGRVVLRIEDLDRERSKAEWVEACLRDLDWLGLDWDGEALFQSADTAPLDEACSLLLERGQAYPCVCTRSEIAALSAPQAGEREVPYPGTCRGRWRTPEEARGATGRAAGIRLAVPPGSVAVEDRLRGEVLTDVAAEVGDFLIRRRDGVHAYQLAVVVDDARQGVTEVLRGDDLLPSAARQALLLDRLDLGRPSWVHVPLVVHPDGRRLAKRRRDLALSTLRASGADPRAVAGWAARSAGLDCGARPRAAEVLAAYRPEALSRSPAVLDEETLRVLTSSQPG